MNRTKHLNLLLLSAASLIATGAALSAISSQPLLTFAEGDGVDIIANSSSSDWFHNDETEDQGTWNVADGKVSVDAFGGAYALDGANYITKGVSALGAYDFEALINITDVKSVQNPMVGIIPWYEDEDNYLTVQLKFTTDADYLLSDEEKSEGYGIEQVIVSGKYDGEAKYITSTSQQENTVYDALSVNTLKSAKLAPKDASGHKIGVKLENNSATATSYKVTVTYNDVEVGSSYAYYYNAIAENDGFGFMAQDVKATFSNAYVDDYYASNTTAALARDWKKDNGFTRRVQNGNDVWSFGDDGGVSINAGTIKESSKKVSEYKVSGSNFAGYDTNRGFTENPNKENSEGLPQNYSLSASFKHTAEIDYSGTRTTYGYGLLAWYKNDQNFVDVTLRQTITGLAAAPSYLNELVLFGWIDCSSSEVGETTYDLGESFDMSVSHTIKVEKKSNRFFVYLDEGETPLITKTVNAASLNYYYGYEGYNCEFSASALSSSPIYEAYDEIAVLDENGETYRVAGNGQDAWSFADGSIAVDSRGEEKRSYLLKESDISDKNLTLEMEANVSLGDASYSEVLLAPFVLDENNYCRIGLMRKDGQTYAYIRASTYTEEDIDEEREPTLTVRRLPLSGVSLEGSLKLKAAKIETTLALYVNDELVYGRSIADIDQVALDYGVYAVNAKLSISRLETSGYKRYTKTEVGEWTTSGMKYNEWTIDDNGYLAGDATYTSDMEKEEKDAERNYALMPNTIGEDYEMTVDIKATAQSEAEDRVGVVMWYLDDDNFMIFYLDRWRMDSTVPRTTIYGRIEGETLPTTYNHGGWLAEGDNIVDEETGLTQTAASQVDQWHTIKVIKEDDNFTCYIDNETNGYISYTVAGGLPSTDGKTLYSGIYSYNDAVLVRSYDVTSVGGFTSAHTPCEAGKPYNVSVTPPELGTYADEATSDEIDIGVSNNAPEQGSDDSNPSNPDDSSSDGDQSQNTSASCGGCGGSIAGGSIFAAIALIGALGLAYKRKKDGE